MKKKINVIDLDGTLIPYDSFRAMLKHYLFVPGTGVQLIYLSILRKLGFCSRKCFAERTYFVCKSHSTYDKFSQLVAERALEAINQEVLARINEHTDDNTKNILCSASPQDYVTKIADAFKWQGIGSHFDNNSFVHMYGENKLKTINKLFPIEKFDYNYSISDSKSDMKLLTYFREYTLL
ncbi:MAG: HAD family hydrolase [Bacteriovoracaceae bacterium]|jgi:phosphoserine phosphatase|nr:HAD family hydrolase [Bacteriovoracaceae bacterium]